MDETSGRLLEAMFDDAAVFPPGSSALDSAILNHLARRSTLVGPLTGPLLIRLDQVDETHRLARLSASLLGIDLTVNPLSIGIVVPDGHLDGSLSVEPTVSDVLEIATLELKTSAENWRADGKELHEASTQAAKYLELTGEQVGAGALETLSHSSVNPKFRTGGLQAHLFPTPKELATIIQAAVTHETPFKLTAGLHQAVRHTSETTGLTHHGFLNIALATEAANAGQSIDRLQDLLEETDSSRIVTLVRSELTSDWRRWFRSFGTCSVAEPIDSWVDLGFDPHARKTDANAANSPELGRVHT